MLLRVFFPPYKLGLFCSHLQLIFFGVTTCAANRFKATSEIKDWSSRQPVRHLHYIYIYRNTCYNPGYAKIQLNPPTKLSHLMRCCSYADGLRLALNWRVVFYIYFEFSCSYKQIIIKKKQNLEGVDRADIAQ